MGPIKVTLLTSGIYKRMKGVATHLFTGRQTTNRTFSKLSNFYFDLRPPGGRPPGKTEERKPDPGSTKMCESPGVARGDGKAWN